MCYVGIHFQKHINGMINDDNHFQFSNIINAQKCHKSIQPFIFNLYIIEEKILKKNLCFYVKY